MQAKKEVSFWNVIKLSGAVVAYLIGSGFATGQEVLQFYASHGINSLLGIVISTVLFCTLGAILMRTGYTLKLDQSGEIFRYYTGRHLGRFLDQFTILFIFSIVVVMISGSGAIVHEYFKVNSALGIGLMSLICMATVLFGLKNLVDIIGTIGPSIVVFTVIVGVVILFRDFDNLANQPIFNQLPAEALALQPSSSFIVSATLFVCYNTLASIVFFTQLGKTANSKKEATIAGITGGAMLMLAVAMITVGLLAHFDDILTLQVPTLYLGESIHPFFGFLFSIVILLGVYSTTAPMYWIIKNEAMRFFPLKYNQVVTVALGIIFLVGGFLPFGKLVGMIYSLVGYVGFIMIITVFVRTLLAYRRQKKA